MQSQRKPYPKNRQPRQPRIERTCGQCGKTFMGVASEPGHYCSNACYHLSKKQPLEERFWSKVEKTETCWLWTGALYKDGYGEFGVDGATRRAHRIAWELVNGPIPDGMQLLHTCDRPRCVNPAHLVLGTQLDNIADAVAKGRMKRPNVRIAVEREIQQRLAAGEASASELAEAFDVSMKTIYRITRRDCS